MATNEEQAKEQIELLRAQLSLKNQIAQVDFERLEHSKDEKKILNQMVAVMTAGGKVTEEDLKNAGIKAAVAKETLELMRRTADTQRKIKAEIEEINKALKAGKESLEAWKKTLGSLSAGFAKISGIDFKKIFDSPLSLAGEFLEIAIKADQAGKDLSRLTGQMSLNANTSIDLATATRHLGTTNAEAAKIQGELFTSYSDFFFMSKDMREETGKLAVVFQGFGLDANDLGMFIDNLTRGMGFTKKAANSTAEELANFASEIGVVPKEMSKAFAELSGELSKYGKKGMDVFKTLLKTSKSLAINVKDAMRVATLFDTFSGAAKTAGLLNAQLGLGLNAVSLMKADEGERLEILRQRFKEQGKEFGSMHRREKQAVASMLGVEVDIATRLFGDKASWAEVAQDQKTAEERAETLTSITKHLAVAMEALAPAIKDVITWLQGVVKYWSDNRGLLKFIMYTTIAVSVVMKFAPFLKKLVMAFGLFSKAAASTAPAMAVASAGALPLSLAILAIGAGVGIAALGMSYLVAEFAKMDPAQILASAAGMLALAGSMWIFSGAVIALVPVLPALAAGMLTLGAILGGFGLLALAGVLAMNSLGNSFVKIGEGLAQAASAMSELSFSQLTGMSSALTGLRNSLAEFLIILGQMGLTGNMGMLMTFFDDLATKSQGFDAIKMNAATDLLLTTKEVLIAAPQAGGEQNINRVKDVISATASGGGGDPGLKKSIDSLVRALNNPRATGAKGGSQKPFNIIVKIDGADAAEALWPKLEPHFNKTG